MADKWSNLEDVMAANWNTVVTVHKDSLRGLIREARRCAALTEALDIVGECPANHCRKVRAILAASESSDE